MKQLGYLLITLGFLAGSFVVVRQPEGVDTGLYLAALGLGVLGVLIARGAKRAEARDVTRIEANIGAIETALARIAEDAARLDDAKASIDVYDLKRRIDESFPEHLVSFVEARESIAHSYGLQAYAEVMNRFAAGERFLNRVWSASTDGYRDEAYDYLGRARTQFSEALDTFRKIRSGGARGGAPGTRAGAGPHV
jgi:hypothetical protein